MTTLLVVLPAVLADVMTPGFAQAGLTVLVHGRDAYDPAAIDYALSSARRRV